MRARNPKERRPHTHSQNHKTSCHHAMKGSTDRLRILKIPEYKKEISIVPPGTLKSINTHYRCSKPRSPPVNSTLLSQPPRSVSHHTRRHLVCLLFLTTWKNHSKTILQLPCSTSARSDIYPVTTTTLLHSIFIFFSHPPPTGHCKTAVKHPEKCWREISPSHLPHGWFHPNYLLLSCKKSYRRKFKSWSRQGKSQKWRCCPKHLFQIFTCWDQPFGVWGVSLKYSWREDRH